MPGGSRTDLLLTRAKPITDGSNDLVTCFRREKILRRCNCAQRSEECKVKGGAVQTPRSVVNGGGGDVLQVPGKTFSFSLLWKPWWSSSGLPSCGNPCGMQRSTCNPWRNPHLSRWETVTLWEGPGAGSCQGPADPWREVPMLNQFSWSDLWPYWGTALLSVRTELTFLQCVWRGKAWSHVGMCIPLQVTARGGGEGLLGRRAWLAIRKPKKGVRVGNLAAIVFESPMLGEYF